MPPIHRRSFVQSVAIAPLLLSGRSHANSSSPSPGEVFQHGVASGDPDANSVVIWTRISGQTEALPVAWAVASDENFTHKVAEGLVSTDSERDYTVKVVVDNLNAGRQYFYRFEALGVRSPVGRTRTLPTGQLASMGLAIASCSNYAFGYFNAYQAIADDAAIDFVLHLGDYIYEYGADGWGAEVAIRLGRSHEPAHETLSLSDYRERHAQYKTDPGSQAMHAAHPTLLVWDDHESANNPWLGGAQNHSPATEGDWLARRAASLRAYYEWMPVREPDAKHYAELWRHYTFGDLATLTTLETRHTGRAKQISYQDHFESINSIEDATVFETKVLGAPNRPMLSSRMEDFLQQSLRSSVDSAVPWRVIGNAIPMAKTRVPDLASLGIKMPAIHSNVPGSNTDLIWKGRYNLPFYLDTWDGYPWARERFYTQCQKVGASDLLVVTGDSHSFWANTLSTESSKPVGVEIGTAGISSPGDFVEQGFDDNTARMIDMAFAEHQSEVRWTDNLHQGYVRLTLQHDGALADFVAVSTVLSPRFTTFVVHQESIRKQGEHLAFVDSP